jgi:hypothetical protein
MLMEVRDSSAANAIEALRARRVIGTAIASFLNIIEYLSFSKDWTEESLNKPSPFTPVLAISLNFRRRRMIVQSFEKVSTQLPKNM